MKLEINDKVYFMSSFISEYWLMDLSIPKEIININKS